MSTKLNMLLQLRRDEVFTSTYVLEKGEPGFEISTNTLKIGDGTKTWAELDFANEAQIEALIAAGVKEAKDYADGKFKVKQTEYSATGDVKKTVTGVAQNANGEIEVTFGDIDFSHDHDDQYKKLQDAIEAAATEDNVFAYGVAQNANGEIEVKTKAVKLDEYRKAADQNIIDNEIKADITNITKEGGLIATAKQEAIDAAKDETEAQVSALENGAVKANADAITAINAEDTGILAQAKSYVDTEDVFHTDILTVNALGGIGAGADLNNMTTHEILNTLLFPYVAFVVGSASRSAAAATLENGATQTLSSASITVTKKSKPITSIKLLNGSTVLEEKTGDAVAAGGTITFNGFDAITVSKSNNPNLKFTITDGQTTTDKSVGASTFVYPYYWGVCAPDATIDEALVEGLTKSVSSKGTKTDISFTCANQKIVFAYPKAHGVLKSIIDPNNFETIDGYARSEVSITGLDGTAQAYYVYVQKDACTVTDFKVDFKY